MVYYPGSISPQEMPGALKKQGAPPKPEKQAAPTPDFMSSLKSFFVKELKPLMSFFSSVEKAQKASEETPKLAAPPQQEAVQPTDLNVNIKELKQQLAQAGADQLPLEFKPEWEGMSVAVPAEDQQLAALGLEPPPDLAKELLSPTIKVEPLKLKKKIKPPLAAPAPDTQPVLTPEEETMKTVELPTDKKEEETMKTVELPTEKKVEQLVQEAKALTGATLLKISENLGSNPGGWYEDQESGKKYYVKLYKNPEQARVEFIANAIYKKLGIRAVDSQLFDLNGQLAIASEAIPCAAACSEADQKDSPEVRDGFVADAFLANWDVVGLVNDNIVKGKDNHFHRIDNGGSLHFRAQGGPKNFPADKVDELETMRNQAYTAGRVFSGLTEDDLIGQVRHLADNLKESDIKSILKQSGLAKEQADQLKKSLLGRRKFLIERFVAMRLKASPNAMRVPKALELIQSQEKSGEMRRKLSLPADKDKIENQQIDIIDATDEGRYEINFKLTKEQFEKISTELNQLLQAHYASGSSGEPLWKGKYPVTKDYIRYGNKNKNSVIALVGSFDIKVDGLTIQVADKRHAEGQRAALGLVNIKVPAEQGKELSEEELSEKVFDIFEEALDIRDALAEPGEEETREYARNRYDWHHKLKEPGQPPVDWNAKQELEKKLRRQEVLPGYRTIVEQGKHLEYEKKFGPYALFHSMRKDNLERLPDILKQGLNATHERYRRGWLCNGESSDRDLRTGGADSVFTGIVTRESLQKSSAEQQKMDWDVFQGEYNSPRYRIYFIFQPRVLDRTDWYAYGSDQYGSTAPDEFSQRKSPDEFFNKLNNEAYITNNEQMFRVGISSADIKAIACFSDEDRAAVLDTLKNANITEINGQPVAEFVKVSHLYDDLVKISHDEPLSAPPAA